MLKDDEKRAKKKKGEKKHGESRKSLSFFVCLKIETEQRVKLAPFDIFLNERRRTRVNRKFSSVFLRHRV